MAWKQAGLPADARLTLVCRVLDDGIRALAAQTPQVRLLPGVPAAALPGLHAESHLFVMPSLVEGFGQVYLEALAQGCPVLGTANTALPDLGGEPDGIFLTPPGDVGALSARLVELAGKLPASPGLRLAAQATAARFTWPAFRSAITARLPS